MSYGGEGITFVKCTITKDYYHLRLGNLKAFSPFTVLISDSAY